ncbi:hypothetical protein AB0I81_30640 [Nonomuraea sp. NPDC050404]
MSLDRYTGEITGTPATAGTVQLSGYDKRGAPLTRDYTITVG